MIPAKLQYTKTTVQIARPSAAPRHRVPPFERNYQAREVKTPARACGATVTAGQRELSKRVSSQQPECTCRVVQRGRELVR